MSELSVEDLLAAPCAVALLGRIEQLVIDWHVETGQREAWKPSHVHRAVETVRGATLGTFLSWAIKAADEISPWSSSAPKAAAEAYRDRQRRRPIAEAICERFGSLLLGPVDGNRQEFWCSAVVPGPDPKPLFQDFSWVYDNGEFTWDGLRTVTEPPPEVHYELIWAWEMYPGPVTRWKLPVEREVSVWNIDHPKDWVRLVETYPRFVESTNAGWNLPRTGREDARTAALAAQPGQRAIRLGTTSQCVPDWEAVARDYDGVHLSWAGFLTAEGYVSELPDGTVTMLRYWGSERTLWLRDVFGTPLPLAAPSLDDGGDEVGQDPELGSERMRLDMQGIGVMLGRQDAEPVGP